MTLLPRIFLIAIGLGAAFGALRAQPTVTTARASKAVVAKGSPLTLTMAATGTAPITYAWRKDGRVLAGETASTLTKAATVMSDNGVYIGEATDGAGKTARSFYYVYITSPTTQVVAWGSNTSGETIVPAGLTNVIAVAGGYFHSAALKADGTIVAWGNNTYGQATVPAGVTDIIAIAAGGSGSTGAGVVPSGAVTLALKRDRTVVQMGTIATGTTVPKPVATNAVAIAVGNSVCMVLTVDGTVLVWGSTRQGQTTVPFEISNIVAIAAGRYTCYALRADGVLLEWGALGSSVRGNAIVSISSGWQHFAALTASGNVLTGVNATGIGPVVIPPLTLGETDALTSGFGYTLAVERGGNVVPIGRAGLVDYGQTAGPFYEMRPHAISAGANHGLALRDTVGDTVPVMVQTAASRTVTAGQATTFTAAATGGAMRYQWQRNEVDIAGAIAPTYTIANVQAAQGGSYRVKVSNYLGTTFSEAATLIVQTPFASWQAARFTADELTTPSISAPNATPAGDGVPNLLKFALGIAPREAVPADRMTLAASTPSSPDGAPEWVFTYRRPQDVVGVTYAVEISGDLAAWTTDGVVHERQSAADTAGLETWTARRAATPPPSSATAPLFFRLKVQVP